MPKQANTVQAWLLQSKPAHDLLIEASLVEQPALQVYEHMQKVYAPCECAGCPSEELRDAAYKTAGTPQRAY